MEKMWEMLPLIVMVMVVPFIVKYLFMDKPKEYVSSSLKWGMVLIAIGLAVFVGQIAPKELVEEVTIGAMFVFGGIALVIYYAIASKKINEQDKNRLEQPPRL
jgi:uncharacterized membrane protein YgdD (TMEM256/DUF423 family)